MRTIDEIERQIQECSMQATQKEIDALWLEWFRAIAQDIQPDRLKAICNAERDER